MSPSGPDEIDRLLELYEREVGYFVETQESIEPLLDGLVPALTAWFADRSSAALHTAAARWRARYVTRIEAMQPLLQDWLAIRGSGLRLWEAQPFMSDRQADRFASTNARELAATAGREHFDALHDRARRLLLLFEEATPFDGDAEDQRGR